MTFRKLFGVSLVLAACVGDDSTTVDGGNDATTSDVMNGGDAGSADASDASPPKLVEYSAGDTTSCAVYSDGSIWCWGNDGSGQTGQMPPTQTPQTVPQKVPGLPPMKFVSVGGFFACAIAEANTVWCWGKNDLGQLGHAPTTGGDILCATDACNPIPSQVGSILATGLTSSADFACAITSNGINTGVTCWGQNNAGQLGMVDSGAPTAVVGVPTLSTITEIVAKYPGGTVCLLDMNTHPWCWGDNTWGQTGHTPNTLGDFPYGTNRYGSATPHEVSYSPDGGGGFLNNVLQIHASYTTCAVIGDAGTATNGELWCWGSNAAGNLANGTADIGGIVPHPQPAQVTSLSNVVDVRGGNSLCALVEGGGIWCWGAQPDVNGSVGTGMCAPYNGVTQDTCELTPVQVSGVSALGFTADHVHALALDKDAGLVAWGNNSSGELGHAPGTDGDFQDGSTSWQNAVPTPVQGLP